MNINREMRAISSGDREELTNSVIQEIMCLNKEELYEFAWCWGGYGQVLDIFKKMEFLKIKDIMPMLFDHYLGDLNQEGSNEVSKFIISLGSPVVPFIKDVLKGRGQELIYNVLIQIIEKLPKEIVDQLEEELCNLVWDRDEGNGYQIDAIRILYKKGIWSYDKAIGTRERLRSEYEFYLKKLKEDEEEYRIT